MPDKLSHLAHAKHNQEAIDYLLQEIDRFSGWIATIAFYKAVHLVEALFAHDKIDHSTDHQTREARLKSTRRYQQIYKFYRPLSTASLIARYMTAGDPHKDDVYAIFTDYISPDDMRKELLDHDLKQLEKSANKLMNQ